MVSPVALLAQAALETGYGKSVIPGTNNLFNIKDPSGKGVAATALRGALFGFVAYATYDLTNLATLEAFTWRLSLIDMAWGTIATGLASAAGAASARLG